MFYAGKADALAGDRSNCLL